MNEKEIGEIRRRVRRDRSNMTAIFGCYVNEKKEIISEFQRGTAIMPENGQILRLPAQNPLRHHRQKSY